MLAWIFTLKINKKGRSLLYVSLNFIGFCFIRIVNKYTFLRFRCVGEKRIFHWKVFCKGYIPIFFFLVVSLVISFKQLLEFEHMTITWLMILICFFILIWMALRVEAKFWFLKGIIIFYESIFNLSFIPIVWFKKSWDSCWITHAWTLFLFLDILFFFLILFVKIIVLII